jgi:hypothetical protein
MASTDLLGALDELLSLAEGLASETPDGICPRRTCGWPRIGSTWVVPLTSVVTTIAAGYADRLRVHSPTATRRSTRSPSWLRT